MTWTLAILLPLAALAALFAVRPLRRALLTRRIFAVYRRMLPQMSQTEREALEAGSVWWEGELFRGRPDWDKLLAYPQPRLTAAEQSFLDNETEELCRLSDDWVSSHYDHDLSPEAWRCMKEKGFFGMIIPKRYGGLEFSAYAHSQVVTKLATRCAATTVSVMVPNSLGPAELLLHYGSEEQKNHYLPRLAKGLEIPCFALTSPWAGSDAAAIPDRGVVCKGQWQGREVIGMRVTWDKRYITLAPVATVVGLAFRLFDPERLLGGAFGGNADIGITCALVPADHPGVETGRRHFPLNAAWMNGPTRGHDVFMPLDFIIGGPRMAGQGWRMLMECLAAGRSISLPASNTGMQKLAVRAVGGYARVRSQFKTAIGKFEGIQEALARMGGNLYLSDAARVLTAGAIDLGEKPSLVSAIVKYHVTERARQSMNDGMDILGGKGICLGPSNFLGRAYQQVPVAITVEGANILTRSLIIFGQGAIRCHPWVMAEMQAAQANDLAAFDRALFAHVRHTLGNGLRALFTGLTGSHFVKVPQSVAPETRRYYQQLTRFSAAFAFMADISMLVMGGDLKRKEKLSARMADILSLLYLSSAVLKRYEAEGRQQADAPLMHWAIWDAMFRAQNAFEGVVYNFPSRFVSNFLCRMIFPLGRPYVVPSDRLGGQVAELLIAPSATRDRLTAGMHLPRDEDDPVGVIELALEATLQAEPARAKLRAARKAGKLAAGDAEAGEAEALARGLITSAEQALLARARALAAEVIKVDDFPFDLGLQRSEPKPEPRRAVA
ncbi:MAG TPA: acyl-CoA dehydrogenase [Candidatus Desulfobacillus sp.]|nr:acyl-CoA dehydrogenase [Candidatus Desulfobacillus sp.]